MASERTVELDRKDENPAIAPARKYGVLSGLRSYFIFDLLIWFYTVVLGIVSIPVSLFGEKSRILHGFARFWSWLIMKTILSPVKVTGLEKIDTSKAACLRRNPCFCVGHSGAVRQFAIRIPHSVQERNCFRIPSSDGI